MEIRWHLLRSRCTYTLVLSVSELHGCFFFIREVHHEAYGKTGKETRE